MGKPVEIRYKSADHVEFCDKCGELMRKDWWRCAAAGKRRGRHEICAELSECPLGKWKRA